MATTTDSSIGTVQTGVSENLERIDGLQC